MQLSTTTIKSEHSKTYGYLVGILYLAPHRISGHNVCPFSTKGCRKVCLYKAGRGTFTSVQRARIAKTKRLYQDRKAFLIELEDSIRSLCRRAKRLGLKPCIRLNGTSDLPWETKAYGCLPQKFPDIQFYDYSKNFRRVMANKVTNYFLSYSVSESPRSVANARKALAAGKVVVAVFDKVKPGLRYLGRPVLVGDAHDLRFLDQPGSVIGVNAKGPARHDTSGFVHNTEGAKHE